LQSLAPTEFKSCCANLYADETLLFLLGPSLHPGGLDLTKKLADRLGISESDTVLDVACGVGSTVSFLESNYECNALGIDLSNKLARKASIAFKTRRLGFANADGESLPFEEESFTHVISECSLCLMPESHRGISEALRVLKHGGRFGITDLAVRGSLPEELDNVLTSLLCVSRKVMWRDYSAMVEREGFEKIEMSDESASLVRMLEGIKKRLLLAELLAGTGKLSVRADQIAMGKRLVALARNAVNEHNLGYLMLVARKP
jgi:SAM-dependent methyltransferase